MRHAYVETIAQDPADSRIQGDEWNADHTLGADENFVSDAQLAALASHVSSSAVITDHAIVRGDGGAKGVQDSGVLIDDSDNVTFPANIYLNDVNTYIAEDGSSNLSFTDAVTGTKTLAELAAGGAASYTLAFDGDDLDASEDLAVTHSLGKKYVNFNVYDENDASLSGITYVPTDTNTGTLKMVGAGMTGATTYNLVMSMLVATLLSLFTITADAAEYTVQTPKSFESILGVPAGTVAQMLAISSPQDGLRYDVNDGSSRTDCGVGGGSFDVECSYHDSTWEHTYGGTGPVAVTLSSFAGRGLEQTGGENAIHVKPDVYCANIPAQNATVTDWIVFRASEAMTVTGVDCIVDAGTSVVMTPQECDGDAGTCADIEAAITCGTTNTTEDGTVDNATIDAGDYIRITRGAVTGAVNQAMMCLSIKFDD